jgi:hypothetical protein
VAGSTLVGYDQGVRDVRDTDSANVIDATARGALNGRRIAGDRGLSADRVHRADRPGQLIGVP